MLGQQDMTDSRSFYKISPSNINDITNNITKKKIYYYKLFIYYMLRNPTPHKHVPGNKTC